MATYVYKCKKCEKQFEVVQKMVDNPFKIHNEEADPDFDNCLGELSKIFSPVGIVWKGSGFYKTDTRSSGSSKPAAAKTETSKTETKSKDTPKKSESNSSSTSTNSTKTTDKPSKN